MGRFFGRSCAGGIERDEGLVRRLLLAFKFEVSKGLFKYGRRGIERKERNRDL